LSNRHESITYTTESQRTKQPIRREDLARKCSIAGSAIHSSRSWLPFSVSLW
jgi:hypothetical protein